MKSPQDYKDQINLKSKYSKRHVFPLRDESKIYDIT